MVFVAGDRALATSRSDLPASGWSRAATVGATDVGDEPFAVRRLAEPVVTSPDGGLWVVLSVQEFARAERRLLLEFLALLAAGVVVLAGVVLAFLPAAGGRGRGPPSGPRPDGPRVALERRNRELEALNAVFSTMSRGSDLATTAGETLEVVRGLAGMDVGAIYRLDHDGNQLVMEGQSGFDPRHLDRSRKRPWTARAWATRCAPARSWSPTWTPRRPPRRGSGRWRPSGPTAPSSRCRSRSSSGRGA